MVKGDKVLRTPPSVVAAIDFNHNGSELLARRLIASAVDAGASAVKFSLRRMSHTVASEILDAPWLGARELGNTHRDVWQRIELPTESLSELREEARSRLDFIVAPHDETDFKNAERLSPDAYQLDPPALGNHDLLAALAQTGKPVFLVAAMCNEKQIKDALDILGSAQVVLLHAVSAASMEVSRTRLGLIPWLKTRFDRPVGYCGWESGIICALVAASLGAEVIEKPLTLDRGLPGPFHATSLSPDELRTMVLTLRDLHEACQVQSRREIFPEEIDLLETLSTSIVARRRLRRGMVVKRSDLMLQSPLRGMSPKLLDWVDGKRLLYDVEAGDPLTFGLIE